MICTAHELEIYLVLIPPFLCRIMRRKRDLDISAWTVITLVFKSFVFAFHTHLKRHISRELKRCSYTSPFQFSETCNDFTTPKWPLVTRCQSNSTCWRWWNERYISWMCSWQIYSNCVMLLCQDGPKINQSINQ